MTTLHLPSLADTVSGIVLARVSVEKYNAQIIELEARMKRFSLTVRISLDFPVFTWGASVLCCLPYARRPLQRMEFSGAESFERILHKITEWAENEMHDWLFDQLPRPKIGDKVLVVRPDPESGISCILADYGPFTVVSIESHASLLSTWRQSQVCVDTTGVPLIPNPAVVFMEELMVVNSGDMK